MEPFFGIVMGAIGIDREHRLAVRGPQGGHHLVHAFERDRRVFFAMERPDRDIPGRCRCAPGRPRRPWARPPPRRGSRSSSSQTPQEPLEYPIKYSRSASTGCVFMSPLTISCAIARLGVGSLVRRIGLSNTGFWTHDPLACGRTTIAGKVLAVYLL